MRKILHWTLALTLAAAAWGVTPAKKKGTSKTAAKTGTKKAAPKSTTASAGKKGSSSKGMPKNTTTWRNRQMAPSPERYREIQDALAAKGYLDSSSSRGTWDQTAVDALKRFQIDQNIDSTGKINSLSLIALGLGPKHGAPAPEPAETKDPK